MSDESNLLKLSETLADPANDKGLPVVMSVEMSPLLPPHEQSVAISQGAAKMGMQLVTLFCHQQRVRRDDKNVHQFVFNLNQKYYELQAWCSKRIELEKVEYAKLMDEYEAFKAYYEGIFDFIARNYATDGANEVKALYDAWVKNGGSAGEKQ